jgi:ABC-type sugar transport system ATPase subunit
VFNIAYNANGPEDRLAIRGGEIVGIAGLVGAGRTRFAKALTGNGPAAATIEIDGRTLQVSTARDAMRHGIVYITEDRKRDGLFTELDVIANTTASVLSDLARGPFRDSRREQALAGDVLRRLRLVARRLDAPVVSLSGGNQQKVLIGRALLTKPRMLVCDEPTRGIDVGAKAEIHGILRDLAEDGVAVLVISSEIDELLALADRILVMHDHRFVAEMPAHDTDEAAILVAASGSRERSGVDADG